VILKENKLSKRLNPIFCDNYLKAQYFLTWNTKLRKGFSAQHKGNIASREKTNGLNSRRGRE